MGQGPTDDSFDKDMNEIEIYLQLYMNCHGGCLQSAEVIQTIKESVAKGFLRM